MMATDGYAGERGLPGLGQPICGACRQGFNPEDPPNCPARFGVCRP